MSAPRPAFSFTGHAVDRFLERVRPGLSDRDALLALTNAARRAELLPRRTRRGQAIWHIDDPPMRWITKPDAGLTVVVTVLDGTDGGEDDAEQEVIEAHRRLGAVREIAVPTTPTARPRCCEKHDAQWFHVETERLALERKRIKVAAGAIAAQERIEAEREKTARHFALKRTLELKAVRYRNELLCEAAQRLAEVDPSASADLLTRIDDVLRAEERSHPQEHEEATS